MPEEWYDGARFYRNFSFRFGDCSREKTASLFAVMKLFSEMAGEDYEGRGLGHTVLWEHGQAFLLARMALRVHRLPRYAEKTEACTWERFTKGAFFYRDYEIKSEEGEKLVSATSLWFIVDPSNREVLRPEALINGRRMSDPTPADCPQCRRIREKDDLPLLGERPVWYSDIDANGHVNNAVYGKIADDFLPGEYRNNVREFFIDFKTETKLGSILKIEGAPTGDGFLVQGISDGALHFGAEFKF